MINKKKEGGFYASKVRLFLNEYDGIPLEEFCKAEKIAKPVKEVTADNSLLPTLELKELVVDMPCAPEKSDEDYSRVAQISNPKPTKVSHLIENISISINSRIGVNIGKCDVTTLSALIREMEGIHQGQTPSRPLQW